MPSARFLTTDEQTVVWRTAWRIVGQDADARDVCQEIACELLAAGGLDNATNRLAVLRWLATRRSLDRLRRRAKAPQSLAAESDFSSSRELLPTEAAELAELTDRLREELARLPEAQATAFWLAGVDERPHAEVAEFLKSTPAAVAQLVRRARSTLRARLAAFDPHRQS